MFVLDWHWKHFPDSWHRLVLPQQSTMQYLSLTVLIDHSKLDLRVEEL